MNSIARADMSFAITAPAEMRKGKCSGGSIHATISRRVIYFNIGDKGGEDY